MNIYQFKQLKTALLFITACLLSSAVVANSTKPISTNPPIDTNYLSIKPPVDQKLYDKYPWGVLYYYGITGTDAFVQMVKGQFHRWPEHIQTVELEKTLDENNAFRHFFSPVVGVVQLAAAVTVRNGSNENTIYEVDPSIQWRWANFPWNHYLTTSFALGEGISYASSVPSVEKRNNNNTKRLLNLMLVEATFAVPSYPRLELVARVHHRSGAFGLYHAGNSGSNDVALGIRYLFD